MSNDKLQNKIIDLVYVKNSLDLIIVIFHNILFIQYKIYVLGGALYM
jgi:hypothetical protein